jgi:hypothetical protein
VLGPSSPIPTPCLLLKNMFDPAEEEAHPDFDVEIAADVKAECGKWGQVEHLSVDKRTQVGARLLLPRAIEPRPGPVGAQRCSPPVPMGRGWSG